MSNNAGNSSHSLVRFLQRTSKDNVVEDIQVVPHVSMIRNSSHSSTRLQQRTSVNDAVEDIQADILDVSSIRKLF